MSERPRLLDLFCGAGGAACGYVRAGFEVHGVDHRPQPNYLKSGATSFTQADALEYCREHGHEFDAINASPPCQAYSTATPIDAVHDDLYDDTRAVLVKCSVPWAIENVIGAPYASGIVMCGSMFGLEADGEWLCRHRNFETSHLLFQPPCKHPRSTPITITGQPYLSSVRSYGHSRMGTYALCRRLMGIDWMNRDELPQAIPPAYTEYIGKQLMRVLKGAGDE